jgi:transcription elongation factor Elf1
MSRRSIDETVIVNGTLPKSWKCPHCGKRQSFAKTDDEIFISFMQLIRHCEKCGDLHFWKLELTEDFKKQVGEQLALDLNARIVK